MAKYINADNLIAQFKAARMGLHSTCPFNADYEAMDNELRFVIEVLDGTPGIEIREESLAV